MDTPRTHSYFPGVFPKGQIHDLCPQRHMIPCPPCVGSSGVWRHRLVSPSHPRGGRSLPPDSHRQTPHQGVAFSASGPPDISPSDSGAGFPALSSTPGCHW